MDKKKLLIILIPIIVFSTIAINTITWGADSQVDIPVDIARHYGKTIGECPKEWGAGCQRYPGLYHWIGGLFVENMQQFYYFNIFVFFVFFPLALFFITKNEFVPLTYFLGSSFAFEALRIGAFPSALTMLVWILFLKSKTPTRILLLGVGLLLHNSAFFLLATTWLILFVVNRIDYVKSFFAFAFSTTFNPNGIFHEVSNYPAERHIVNILQNSFFGFASISVLWLFQNKRFDYIVLLAYSIIGSLTIGRAIYPFLILTSVVFADYFKEQPWNYKLMYVIFGVLFVLFYMKNVYLISV